MKKFLLVLVCSFLVSSAANAQTLSIYPNPASTGDVLTIQKDGMTISPATVTISSLLGEKKYVGKLSGFSYDKCKPGLYILSYEETGTISVYNSIKNIYENKTGLVTRVIKFSIQ